MSFAATVIIKHSSRILMLTGLLFAINPVVADEVQLYDAPPSADNVRQALFPELAPISEKKTRTIHMLPSASDPPPIAPQTFNTVIPNESSLSARQSSPRPPSTAVAVSIKFASNSTKIEANQTALLDPIGQMLATDSSGKVRMIVEGHTDAGGSPAYNRNLSQRRANAVKQYLVSRYGIDPRRLTAVGKGYSELLVASNPKDKRNRRIQFRRQ